MEGAGEREGAGTTKGGKGKGEQWCAVGGADRGVVVEDGGAGVESGIGAAEGIESVKVEGGAGIEGDGAGAGEGGLDAEAEGATVQGD